MSKTLTMTDIVKIAREEDSWSEIIEFPRKDWKHEVWNGETNLGYWEWVISKLESKLLEK